MALITYPKAMFGAWPPGIQKLRQEIEDNPNVSLEMVPRETVITSVHVAFEQLRVKFRTTPTAPENTELTTVIIPGHTGGPPLESPTEFFSADQTQFTDGEYKPKLDTAVSPNVDPRLDPGTYCVSWSVDYAGTSVGAVVSLRVLIDQNVEGEIENVEVDVENNWLTWASSADVVITTPSYVNMRIEAKRVAASGAVRMRNVRISYDKI